MVAQHPSLPTLLIVFSTLLFLALERLFPGRELPRSPGWYGRALAITALQVAITLVGGRVWSSLAQETSWLRLSEWNLPVAEGFVGWFIGTFVFYWWHRLRHVDGWWQVFHQVHHSPARIETATSFYKHPLEIFCNSALAAALLYPLLGASVEGAIWYNFFAATGEYFYHSNLRMPAFARYFIQTPALHSIHHQYGVHNFNFGDIPLWDRLFGTYRDTTEFSKRCGFPGDAERRLGCMLAFKDVYGEGLREEKARAAATKSRLAAREDILPSSG